MTPRDTESFQSAVDRRIGAVAPAALGYATLGGAVLGMILYGTFGWNDILTGLIVGAVVGGMAGGLLFRIFFMGIEAVATRRLELAVLGGSVAAMLTIWYLMR